VPATGENYFSPGWYALIGYEPDALPQHVDTFMARVHPDDVELLLTAVERHRRGEAPYDVEHRMLHSDGSYRWMRSRGRFSYEGGVERLTGQLTDISARKRIEDALQAAQWLARLGAWESELASGETWWSDQMYAIAGVEPGTPMTTAGVTAMIHADDRDAFAAGVQEVCTLDSHVGQYRLVRPDGRVAHVRLIGRALRDAEGQVMRMSGACLDVSEQVAADEAIARSLAEKDTLLREIHHRVKNNLAVVGSLLHFHGMQLESARDVEVLEGLRQRIHAMSLVHDRLYQLPNAAGVEFGDYVRVLVADLCRGSASSRVVVDVACDELQLPIETAMPLGQITCELLTNVLKYAFVDGAGGHARVSLQRSGDQGVLCVEDEGVGLPEAFDPARNGSFGWLLVRSLVRQLEGTHVLGRPASGTGTRVEVRFAWPYQDTEHPRARILPGR
jgi:PAS domain S-box-containing protein